MKKNNYLLILVSITLLLFGLSFSISAADYDLTLYSILTTDPDFSDWLNDVETATGLKINVIAAPTNSDTRQQKVTTILSSGDSSIDILELNDEMASSFKNSGWLAPLQAQVLTQIY